LSRGESGQRHAVAAPLEMPWDHFERTGLVVRAGPRTALGVAVILLAAPIVDPDLRTQ
jgi:hypothetical protein